MNPSIRDKRHFLLWLLKHNALKNRNAVVLLNVILQDDLLLTNMHLVTGAHYTGCGIAIATATSDEPGFRFYDDADVIYNVGAVHGYLNANKHKPFYIEIHLGRTPRSYEFVTVLEDNPFDPDLNTDILDAEVIIYMLTKQQRLAHVEATIDQVLESGDRETFYALSHEYSQLKRELEADPFADSIYSVY